MITTAQLIKLFQTPASARNRADLDWWVEEQLKGKTVKLPNGKVLSKRHAIRVANAGFNGFQISGRTASGEHTMGYVR